MAEISVPESLMAVWEAFSVLSRSRSQGFSGPQRIAFVDISACVGMLDIPQPLRFVRLIQAMDDVFISSFLDRQPKKPNNGSRSSRS
jgi:hypothetical protein